VPYGPEADQTLDVFPARGRSRGLAMFIHGGYWRALDKSDFSFIAPGLAEAGVTLAIPNYSLCPRVTLRDIVRQMEQACAWLCRNGSHFGAPAGPIVVCGHSAGGHLTAMMLTRRWPVRDQDLPRDLIRAGLSISGVFDLQDLLDAPSINGDVKLDARSVVELSPARLAPATDAPLWLAVGGEETGGFHHQHGLMLERWPVAREVPCPGHHHFSILDDLAWPGGRLHNLVLSLMEVPK
jgi:arylformamidase